VDPQEGGSASGFLNLCFSRTTPVGKKMKNDEGKANVWNEEQYWKDRGGSSQRTHKAKSIKEGRKRVRQRTKKGPITVKNFLLSFPR